MFVLNEKFKENFLPSVDMTKDEFHTKHGRQWLNYARNVVASMEVTNSENQVDNYVGVWEDAFLFDGFENGKYKFLSPAILQCMHRHALFGMGSWHIAFSEAYLVENSERNDVILELYWKGKSIIPDTDIRGNKVQIGVTNPRYYLPAEVISLFDKEFGYDDDSIDRPY